MIATNSRLLPPAVVPAEMHRGQAVGDAGAPVGRVGVVVQPEPS